MSLKSAPYYWVECDAPGCTERPEYGDYSAWADESSAREYPYDWVVDYNGKDYCEAHTTWDEDLDERVPTTAALA